MNETVWEINAKIFFLNIPVFQDQNYFKFHVHCVNLLELHFVYTFWGVLLPVIGYLQFFTTTMFQWYHFNHNFCIQEFARNYLLSTLYLGDNYFIYRKKAYKISSNFDLEKQHIKKKYLSINFSYNFIQSIFNSFQQKCESLIPNWLFEEKYRKTISIRIPFCQSNIMHWNL